MDGPRRPVVEQARFAARRLDDDGIERPRVQAVGEEQRAVVEHDRPARGHDGDRVVAQDRGRTGLAFQSVRFAPVAAVAERLDDALERHRREPAWIRLAADRRPDRAADTGRDGRRDRRRVHDRREHGAAVAALDERANDGIAVPGRRRSSSRRPRRSG